MLKKFWSFLFVVIILLAVVCLLLLLSNRNLAREQGANMSNALQVLVEDEIWGALV